MQQKIKPLSNDELTKLTSNEQHEGNGDQVAQLHRRESTLKFRRTNSLEIEELIKRIKINKSSGIAKINMYLLKLCFKFTIPQVVHMINLSILNNDIPSAWKSSVITPIHKAGSERSPGNYRPISCLPITAKLLEQCIHIQVIEYLNRNNLLTEKQFGFRSNYSTMKAVSTLLLDVYTELNRDKYVSLCFVDYRKAFDTVAHDVLLNKLNLVGITGSERGWFETYLSQRTQRVKVNGGLSGEEEVQCGVPQGSTLGPLLFLIYINDIIQHVPCSTLLFADDTVIYSSGNSPNLAAAKLQKGLDMLSLWTRHSRLTVNAGKSKVMLILPKKCNNVVLPSLMLDEQRLEYVSSYKYLGICLDNSLSFKQHVKLIIRNVSHKIYILAKIRDKLTEKAAADVLKVMILPLFDYGDIIYLATSGQLLNKLRILLNRAIRVVGRLKNRDNTDETAARLGIQSLEKRRLCHLLHHARWMASTGKCKDNRNIRTRSHAEHRN